MTEDFRKPEHAEVLLERVERLLAYVAQESASSADAGLLLCASLQGLIIMIEGKADDTMTLGETAQLFLTVRREEGNV